MTQVEIIPTHICPICGEALSEQGGMLHCAEHGDFFVYGPQLLVRCVGSEAESSIPRLMPWERIAESV